MGNSGDMMLRHKRFLAQHFDECDLDAAAEIILLELGIDTSRAGFENLKNAVVLRTEDPRGMITKSLYPAIGRLYEPKVDKEQVERTIRYAIDEAWKKRDSRLWEWIFRDGKKPTNAECISQIALLVDDWQRNYVFYSK